MTIQQIYATLDDLNNPSSADKDELLRAIKRASEYVRERFGSFIPISETRKFNGHGRTRLYIPPLLSVTSITNGATTLATTDYILQPNGAHWPDGPYSFLEVDPAANNLAAWQDEEEGVVIAGTWGMYNRTESTGATVQDDPQSSSQTTLTVSDGSKLSPGMLLSIGSEQQLVKGIGDPTSAVTTLGAALDAASEQCTFTDGTLVKKGEVIRIGFEQCLVLDIQTNSGWLKRGYNKTTKSAHLISSNVDAYRTFEVERAANGTTAAAHTQDTAISRYLVPDLINLLTVEIATLALKKAESAFAGRTGNVELGTVFYNDIFPRWDIAEIEKMFYIPRLA